MKSITTSTKSGLNKAGSAISGVRLKTPQVFSSVWSKVTGKSKPLEESKDEVTEAAQSSTNPPAEVKDVKVEEKVPDKVEIESGKVEEDPTVNLN